MPAPPIGGLLVQVIRHCSSLISKMGSKWANSCPRIITRRISWIIGSYGLDLGRWTFTHEVVGSKSVRVRRWPTENSTRCQVSHNSREMERRWATLAHWKVVTLTLPMSRKDIVGLTFLLRKSHEAGWRQSPAFDTTESLLFRPNYHCKRQHSLQALRQKSTVRRVWKQTLNATA